MLRPAQGLVITSCLMALHLSGLRDAVVGRIRRLRRYPASTARLKLPRRLLLRYGYAPRAPHQRRKFYRRRFCPSAPCE
ncbi:hypothetical protein AL479_22755 [Citrobacter amalonaticus]|nr:hypothetical protein AL479_22755 [Citrobacter amalonaticus]